MRVRFFNTFDAAAPYFRDLLPYLASKGVEVEMVISKAQYRIGGDFFQAVAGVQGIKIIHTINWGMQPRGAAGKALVMALYLVHALLYSLFGGGVDRNIFLTQPPLFAAWGAVLAKIRRQPYYYVEMDIFPEMLVEISGMRKSSLLIRLINWIYRLILRQADGVIVIGRCMVDKIRSMGVPAGRIHFILNWADERLIRPVDHSKNGFRHSQNWQDKFVVMYAGNLGIPQHFDDILAVAEEMKSLENLVFAFVGGGVREEKVRERVANRQLTNVIVLPFLHHVYPLAEILSAADLHFVSLKDAMTGLAVPSKSYGVMAAGRPILYQGSADGEIARMVLEEEIGVVVPSGDVKGLEQGIRKYLSRPELGVFQGEKARQLTEGSYGRAAALQRYLDLLTSG